MSKANQKVGGVLMKIFELGPESLGNGTLHYEFSPNMNYIAVVGPTNNVKVLDRRGKVKKEIPINSNKEVQSIEWDMDSDTISIVTLDSSSVFLWSVFTKQDFTEVSLGEGEQISFQKWSPTHPILAIGTKKGGLVFYNKKTRKKFPTVFKHSKQVVDGDWNSEGNLSSFL